jgi:hypothetical protein
LNFWNLGFGTVFLRICKKPKNYPIILKLGVLILLTSFNSPYLHRWSHFIEPLHTMIFDETDPINHTLEASLIINHLPPNVIHVSGLFNNDYKHDVLNEVEPTYISNDLKFPCSFLSLYFFHYIFSSDHCADRFSTH